MTLFVWGGFLAAIVVLVLWDLGVFRRRGEPHALGAREALRRTGVWIGLALAFNVVVYFLYEYGMMGATGPQALSGREAALQFLAGYLIEESLSVDNLFVIALILTHFHIPRVYQHRLLFWGILGAVIMRGAMIAVGVALISRFEWVIYVFAGLLIASAVRLLLTKTEEMHPDRNLLVRFTRRWFHVTGPEHCGRFLVRVDDGLAVTPAFLALILIESSDVMFAVDSIPAVFAVTRDPFLIFTSNVFAILGLRSLYFAISGLMDRFRYLKVSLVVLLLFVGAKMLLVHHYPIPAPVSLAVIVAILAVGVTASLLRPLDEPQDPSAPSHTEREPAGACDTHGRHP
jgi:tellurite resistance protein TerC